MSTAWSPTSSQGSGATVTNVSSADTSITVTNPTTTPVLQLATLDVLATNDPPAGNWSNNSKRITAVADPGSAQDAATKNYVDAVALGLTFKQPVDLGTIAALPTNVYANGASGVGATLIATAFGALSVNGTAVSVGQRILVKNEVASANNGIYTVTATGGGAAFYTLTRATDYNQTSEIQAGDAVFVTAGATLADTQWVQTTTGAITVGTTAIAFSQLGATPTLASVLAVGNSAGTKITNLTNGAGAQDAAAFGQLATAGPITSVFSRTGVVAAAASDYNLTQIAAGTNHTIPISGGTVMGSLAAGTSGQRLTSQGSSADPVWQTIGWSNAVNLTSTNTAQTVISQSIPGNTLLGNSGGLLLIVAGRYLQNSGAGRGITLLISYGGTTLWSDATSAAFFTAIATAYPFYLEFTLSNLGATNSQTGSGVLSFANPVAGSVAGQGTISGAAYASTAISGISAVDSTAAQTFLVQATNTASNSQLGLQVTSHLLPLV